MAWRKSLSSALVEKSLHVDLPMFQFVWQSTIFSTDNSPQLTHRFVWPALLFYNFCNLIQLILKKGSFTPLLANHKKAIFPLSRAFLGESKRPIRRVPNQISMLRLETNIYFFTYVQLTFMLNYSWSLRKVGASKLQNLESGNKNTAFH